MSDFKALQQVFQGIKLLYVEDDRNLREQVTIFFKNLTDQLYIAQNGLVGLEMFKTHQPDIVVTDVQMPEMNGIEMIEAIQKINPETLIIVTTAFNEIELLTALIDLGVDTYIKKPIEYKTFHGTLLKLGKMVKAKKEIEDKNMMILQQARLAGMGEILSQIAHHWRQPLNVLALNVQEVKMVKDEGELTNEFIDEFVERSSEVIQSMSSTINTFYGFSNQTKGSTEFNVKEAVQSSLALCGQLLSENRISYELHIDDTLTAHNDRYSFQQALHNIITNSIESIMEKEEVQGRISITADYDSKASLRIDIADNGGGIVVEPIERIYEPYYTTKGPQSGKGLGLYVTRMIVQRHLNGTISSSAGREGLLTSLVIAADNRVNVSLPA